MKESKNIQVYKKKQRIGSFQIRKIFPPSKEDLETVLLKYFGRKYVKAPLEEISKLLLNFNEVIMLDILSNFESSYLLKFKNNNHPYLEKFPIRESIKPILEKYGLDPNYLNIATNDIKAAFCNNCENMPSDFEVIILDVDQEPIIEGYEFGKLYNITGINVRIFPVYALRGPIEHILEEYTGTLQAEILSEKFTQSNIFIKSYKTDTIYELTKPITFTFEMMPFEFVEWDVNERAKSVLVGFGVNKEEAIKTILSKFKNNNNLIPD